MSAIDTFEDIDWQPKPVLRPGMDFHNGVTYITIPLWHNLVKKVRKGKETEDVRYKELQTYVITSDREGYWYDEATLDIEGFQPSEQVYQERTSRWSNQSIRDWLDGSAKSMASQDLFKQVRAVYTDYVEYADDLAYDLMALFVMYTYVFRLFESTGYVWFNGTQASGKSRNLAILNTLGFNAVWASSMSAASLYRKLAGSPGTSCIDESEGFDGERGEELRRILNAGYKDGAKAIRTEKTTRDRYVPIEYDVFGPKALASINPLEPVIASRCIMIPMRPAIRELPDFETHNPVWADLRDQLYVWALDNANGVAQTRDEWRDHQKAKLAPRLIGRQWETSNQFIVMAEYIGGEDYAARVVQYFNSYFSQQQEALNATDRLRTTLRALPRVLATKLPHKGNLYSAKDIHEVISDYMEADAREFFKTKHVSKNLDTLGFRKKVRKAGGIHIELNEDDLRREFAQRRVEPYEEDTLWLEGKINHQGQTEGDEEPPFWEKD